MLRRVLVIAAVPTVFGATLAGVTLHLRGQIRLRMLDQEGDRLAAVARFEAAKTGHAPLDLVLGMVDLEGAIGVRIFDADGAGIAALPRSLAAGTLDAPVAERLREGSPVVRLEQEAWLDTEFADPFGILTDQAVPLLRVHVPLGMPGGAGEPAFAQFLIDGRPLVAALASLDRKLLLQFLVAFGAGAGLIVLIIVAGLRSIDRKNRELAAANRDLTMQAKVAAVGAVSAHLIHGLRNALGGMRLDEADNGVAAAQSARHAESTRRMETMIQEIVDILREDSGSPGYSLTGSEILALTADRMTGSAERRAVALVTEDAGDASFTNREGNIVLLILENLVRNAIEVTPAGERVVIRCDGGSEGRVFSVRDRGPGFPESVRARLWQPVRTVGAGGAGIGLSISRHLALQIGAELALLRSGPDGSELVLRLPRDIPRIE